jgi:hypothetical protein
VEERSPIADELKQIRQSLLDSLGVADAFLRKLRGAIPMDTAVAPKEPNESLVTIVADIKRQTRTLSEVLAMHHDIIGNVGDMNAPGRAMGVGRG